jgi:hypothetical protein
MSTNAQNVKNDSMSNPIQVAAEDIAKKLTQGASADIWVDAIEEGDSQKEIAIHNAQSAMIKGARFINEATAALSAIIEELEGVSDDPESHVSVALRRAQEVMAKYSQPKNAKENSEELKNKTVGDEEKIIREVEGFMVEFTPTSCYIYRQIKGRSYWANLYDLINNRELVAECGGMGSNKYFHVPDSAIEAIENWVAEQRQAA